MIHAWILFYFILFSFGSANSYHSFVKVVAGHNVFQVFSFHYNMLREEGKISRKLIECINTYLLKDGPNLGSQSLEIHNAVQQFVFRCWLTTHDRSLKVYTSTMLLQVMLSILDLHNLPHAYLCAFFHRMLLYSMQGCS